MKESEKFISEDAKYRIDSNAVASRRAELKNQLRTKYNYESRCFLSRTYLSLKIRSEIQETLEKEFFRDPQNLYGNVKL